MCYYTTMIKNRKYVKNKTNDGKVPTLPDRRVEYVPVGCGNCRECRKQKANGWRVRLMEDIKAHRNGKFVTLTLSNESIAQLSTGTIKRTNKKTGELETLHIKHLTGYDKDNTLATKAVKYFNERWREYYGKAIRHWLVTELGHKGTENIHLHGIIWTDEHIDRVREKWKYGWIWPKPKSRQRTYVNQKTVNYIVKYVSKIDPLHKEYKAIVLCSPGIGKNYVNSVNADITMRKQLETYKTSTGHQLSLPTYYRNQIFTEQDKENLWIKRLDKMTRFVDGTAYDISKDEKAYNAAIQAARRKNNELGYGGRTNENRKEQEEMRRDIMTETRIRKAINTMRMKKEQDKQRKA